MNKLAASFGLVAFLALILPFTLSKPDAPQAKVTETKDQSFCKCTNQNSLFQNDAGSLPNLELSLDDDFALSPREEGMLLASTLEGTMVAINQLTGEVLWELNDHPVVRSPYDASKPVL